MRKFFCLILFALVGCQTTQNNHVGYAQQAMQPDRRFPEVIASDKAIEQAVLAEIYDNQELLAQSHVNVNAYNGLLLLTGEVTSLELKAKILSSARVIPHVKMVRDSLVLAPISDALSRANDAQLTEQIKTALMQIHTLPNFDPAVVKVLVENGSVYLLGFVSKEEGSVVVNVVRLQPNVKQIVTAFEYMN